MNTFFYIYISVWGSACILCLILYLKDKNSYALSHANYWHFLFMPWKIITFVISTVGLTAIAPYTGDPTWDYFDALFMSVLTFLSAPWVTGTLYKTAKGNLPMKQALVAFCVWMFSASWSYDLYILCRDGYYPPTWLPNIVLSSILYISAGLLWNLDWKKEKGVIFAFVEEDWPAPVCQPVFMKIVWYVLAFMGIAAAMILPFILPLIF